jgi:hypothetical protein
MADDDIDTAQEEAEDSLFDDLEVPEDALTRIDGIPPIDSDLTVDEKKEFIALLNRFMTLEQRALQLVQLARYTDTKRAPVGLRALQEINLLCGLRGDKATEASPMFQLPADTAVRVTITKVAK